MCSLNLPHITELSQVYDFEENTLKIGLLAQNPSYRIWMTWSSTLVLVFLQFFPVSLPLYHL
jgi:hypothetical protein